MVNPSGLGDPRAIFKVYIANRPACLDYAQLAALKPLQTGDISAIGQACGNGWRKVFNVYAKLAFALPDYVELTKDRKQFINWQEYRDKQLLQINSNTALLFSTFQQSENNNNTVHIIMGRTYGKSLNLANTLQWLDNEFAIDHQQRLIICPYFDYRQLSNAKIIHLLGLLSQLTVSEQNNLPIEC